MSPSTNRRKFVLAATSLAPLVVAIQAFAKNGVEQLLSAEEPKPLILVFDVNETMLNLNALRPQFERVFGNGAALDEWFSLLLQYSMVVTLTDAYSDFGTIGGAVLEMLANIKGVRLAAEDKTSNFAGCAHAPSPP